MWGLSLFFACVFGWFSLVCCSVFGTFLFGLRFFFFVHLVMWILSNCHKNSIFHAEFEVLLSLFCPSQNISVKSLERFNTFLTWNDESSKHPVEILLIPWKSFFFSWETWSAYWQKSQNSLSGGKFFHDEKGIVFCSLFFFLTVIQIRNSQCLGCWICEQRLISLSDGRERSERF